MWAGVENRIVTVDASLESFDELTATDPGAGFVGLGAGDGAMWVTAYPRRALIRIDRRERRVVAVLPLGHLPWRLAFGAGSVWVATSDPVLLRVDPVTEAVSEIPLGVHTPQGSGEPVAVGYGAVWVAVRR